MEKNRPAVRLQYAASFVGMMLYWPLLRRNALFYSIGGHDGSPWEALGWYGLFLVLAILCAGLAIVAAKRHGLHGVPFGVWVVLFAVQAVCKLAETAIGLTGALAWVVAFADVVAYAAVFVALTLMWSERSVALGARTMALGAISSFAVSFILVDLVYLLHGALRYMALALLPLLSALCWRVACGTSRFNGDGDALASPAPRRPVERAPLPMALLVVMGIFMVAGAVIRGLVYTDLAGGPVRGNGFQNVATILFAALVFLYYALGGSQRRSFQLLWSLAAVLFFAGLLLMTGIDGSPHFNTGGEIVIMGRTVLGLVYWIMLCDVARSRPDIPGVLFGCAFVLVEVVSAFLGYIAIPITMEQMGLAPQGRSGVLVGAVAFILIITAILFFNRPQAQLPGVPCGSNEAGGNSAKPLPTDLVAEAHRGLYDACHLTEREAEVAELLAAGNSQKRIAEDLQVSIGTVQSHVKNIYRKLDVHSRQEFIDELNGGR